MLNVLLKNDDSNEFNGGSFSKYEYSNCNVSASESNFSSSEGRPLRNKRQQYKYMLCMYVYSRGWGRCLQCEYLTWHVCVVETLRHRQIFWWFRCDELDQTTNHLWSCKIVDQILFLRFTFLQYILLVQEFLHCGILYGDEIVHTYSILNNVICTHINTRTCTHMHMHIHTSTHTFTHLLLEQRLYISRGRITLVPKHFSHVRLGGDTFGLVG